MQTIDEIREEIRRQPLKGLVVSHAGRVVCRKPAQSRRFLVHSVAKSVTALGVGFAIQEGILGLEENLADAFAENLPGAASRAEALHGTQTARKQMEQLKQVRLKHLLSHTSGFQENFLTGFQRPYLQDDDWLAQCLANPVTATPGTAFLYCDANYYLIAKLLRKRTGRRITEYLLPRLFSPLGIRYPTWEVDPEGDMIGCGGLLLNLDELHRLGLLCLEKGKADGRRIVPEAWVETVTSPAVSLPGGGGYGFGFWTAPEYCCMFGYGGVYNIISYSRDILITADGLALSEKTFSADLLPER